MLVPNTLPLWDKWKARNIVGLVVIGDFPGTSLGIPDQRKRIVPLYKGVWDTRDNALQFEIQNGRIQIVTPSSTKAQKILAKRGWN